MPAIRLLKIDKLKSRAWPAPTNKLFEHAVDSSTHYFFFHLNLILE
jgi:hypothetical protein